MEQKYVKCPKCKAVLLVKNSKGENTKQIVCPQCMASIQVVFDAQEQIVHDGENDEALTKIVSPSYKSAFVLTCNGATYRLKQGENTIGRWSSHSPASITIRTNDMYMSRFHAIIRIITLPNGDTRATISNGRNKNATFVNNIVLQQGDEIYLNDGDEITMGKTTMKIAAI